MLRLLHADFGLDVREQRWPARGDDIGGIRAPDMLTDLVQIGQRGARIEEEDPVAIRIEIAAPNHVEQIVFLVDRDTVTARFIDARAASGGLERAVDPNPKVFERAGFGVEIGAGPIARMTSVDRDLVLAEPLPEFTCRACAGYDEVDIWINLVIPGAGAARAPPR